MSCSLYFYGQIKRLLKDVMAVHTPFAKSCGLTPSTLQLDGIVTKIIVPIQELIGVRLEMVDYQNLPIIDKHQFLNREVHKGHEGFLSLPGSGETIRVKAVPFGKLLSFLSWR